MCMVCGNFNMPQTSLPRVVRANMPQSTLQTTSSLKRYNLDVNVEVWRRLVRMIAAQKLLLIGCYRYRIYGSAGEKLHTNRSDDRNITWG